MQAIWNDCEFVEVIYNDSCIEDKNLYILEHMILICNQVTRELDGSGPTGLHTQMLAWISRHLRKFQGTCSPSKPVSFNSAIFARRVLASTKSWPFCKEFEWGL